MIVEVTKDDIENGIRGHSTCCPIALAVCRVLKIPSHLEMVEVDGYTITCNKMEFAFGIASLYRFVDRWTHNFDEEKLVLPFKFDGDFVRQEVVEE